MSNWVNLNGNIIFLADCIKSDLVDHINNGKSRPQGSEGPVILQITQFDIDMYHLESFYNVHLLGDLRDRDSSYIPGIEEWLMSVCRDDISKSIYIRSALIWLTDNNEEIVYRINCCGVLSKFVPEKGS